MRSFVLVLFVALVTTQAAHAQNADLIGSRFGLEGWNQRNPGDELLKVRVPGSATVRNPGVEFPQVSKLFDTPEGRAAIRAGIIGRFVNTWIDIGPNWIEIDFKRAGSGRFAGAHQNTYVFVFDKSSPIELSRARIDPRTTLRVTPARLWARGNRLFLNVQGLYYDRTSFVRITFDVAPALGAGNDRPGGALDTPRQSAAPTDAPVPVPPPGISTVSGG
ncbi:MAG: hypothetical protein AAF409_10200 [Pseudomonadota bacterium]